jgi:hypothetical protein
MLIQRTSSPSVLIVALIICLGSAVPASAYNGKLKYVFGDVKQGLLGKGGITEENAEAVVDGIYRDLQCNGLRVPIDVEAADSAAIPPAYVKLLERAKRYDMVIYASSLDVGLHDLPDDEYIKKLVAFSNKYRPQYLSPFNEAGLTPERYVSIAAKVKAGLKYKAVLVGPDLQHLVACTKMFSRIKGGNPFGIIASHNAVNDKDATARNWDALAALAGKAPAWSSENPRAWSVLIDGQEVGVKAVVDSRITGLVIYGAYPSCIDNRGRITQKGKEIAEGIGSP